MGEEELATGGAAAAVFDGNIQSLPKLIIGAYSKERFIQECAMTLFCNTEFKSCGMTPEGVAKLAVDRANTLANELGL